MLERLLDREDPGGRVHQPDQIRPRLALRGLVAAHPRPAEERLQAGRGEVLPGVGRPLSTGEPTAVGEGLADAADPASRELPRRRSALGERARVRRRLEGKAAPDLSPLLPARAVDSPAELRRERLAGGAADEQGHPAAALADDRDLTGDQPVGLDMEAIPLDPALRGRQLELDLGVVDPALPVLGGQRSDERPTVLGRQLAGPELRHRRVVDLRRARLCVQRGAGRRLRGALLRRRVRLRAAAAGASGDRCDKAQGQGELASAHRRSVSATPTPRSPAAAPR